MTRLPKWRSSAARLQAVFWLVNLALVAAILLFALRP